ncbi:hypothetical protein ABPG75_008813 [Micractinium tetrahymenae]
MTHLKHADGSVTVGAGIVAELLREGATVVAPLREEGMVERLLADCEGCPTDKLFPVIVDISDEAACEQFVADVQAAHGTPIDHAVSIFGGWWEGGALSEQPLSEFLRVIQDSSAKHFVFAKYMLHALKPALSSSFLFITEGAGKRCLSADTSLYTVSASCTLGIVKAAQREFSEEPFRVNEMRLFSLFKRHSDVGQLNYLDFYGMKAFSSRKVGKLVVEMLMASKQFELMEVTQDRLDGNALTV